MPRTVEIAHYSELLASLMVSAARAEGAERLASIRRELVEAFVGIFTLISHDAGALGFALEFEPRKQQADGGLPDPSLDGRLEVQQ